MHSPDDIKPNDLPEPADRPAEANDAQNALQRPSLLPQEIPLDNPRSHYRFQPSPEKPFVATPAALELYGPATILACLYRLQYRARLHGGLDYLQVFEDPDSREELWFIEDAPGLVTALLPGDR